MRKLIFIVIVLALVAGAAGLKITHLNLINKTEKEVFVKGVSSESVNNVWSYYLNPGEEVVLSIPNDPYWVTASARKCEIDFLTSREVCDDWQTCFGFADEFYWDENKAARLVSFGQGMRKLVVRKDSCQDIPTEMRFDWEVLSSKVYEYIRETFRYIY